MKQGHYKDAVLVQSAVNCSGIVHSMSRMMDELWKEPGAEQGTDWVNRHPLVVLYVAQLTYLSNKWFDCGARYEVALYICEMLSEIEDDEERAKLELVIGEFS